MIPGSSWSPDYNIKCTSSLTLIKYNNCVKDATDESERLPAGSLPIREYDSVVTVHGGADMAARDGIVHGFVL
jgi:hypothetical protein